MAIYCHIWLYIWLYGYVYIYIYDYIWSLSETPYTGLCSQAVFIFLCFFPPIFILLILAADVCRIGGGGKVVGWPREGHNLQFSIFVRVPESLSCVCQCSKSPGHPSSSQIEGHSTCLECHHMYGTFRSQTPLGGVTTQQGEHIGVEELVQNRLQRGRGKVTAWLGSPGGLFRQLCSPASLSLRQYKMRVFDGPRSICLRNSRNLFITAAAGRSCGVIINAGGLGKGFLFRQQPYIYIYIYIFG